jgi:predicted esterase
MEESQSVSFEFNARYVQLGHINSKTRHVWIVLHGYGQLAPYFIRKFKSLESTEQVVIAPEGLSRFYLEGFSGRVGATWMTKEDRNRDIYNYVSYLDAIYKTVLNQVAPESEIQVHIIAFSQGVATASRWLTLGIEKEIASICLWAGVFPPDLPMEISKHRLKDIPLYLCVGDNDPFVTNEKRQEFQTTFLQLGIEYSLITFSGGHDIDSETLNLLQSKILNK